MKKYEIHCFFGADEQHLIETTKTYPRTLDEAFPQDAPNGNPFKNPISDTVVMLVLWAALITIFVDVLVLRP